eukprot:m.162500 g.162500  ORF g.162500 m.162500 type:complete len:643 (-) comp17088_c0_seq5:1350-3278(-)
MKVKSNRKRGPMHRHRPAHMSHMEEVEEEDRDAGEAGAAGAAGGSSMNFLTQMTSDVAEQREFGCATVAVALLDPSTVPLLLRQNVTRILLSCLGDASQPVRTEAAGALRNLTISGGSEVCDRLVQESVMSAIAASLAHYVSAAPAAAAVLGGRRAKTDKHSDEETTLNGLENTLYLLMQIAERAEVALAHLNSSGLLGSLAMLVNPDTLPLSLAIIAAQALQTVTEDNDTAMQMFCDSPVVANAFVSMAQRAGGSGEDTLFRVVVCGCLFNVRAALDANALNIILQVVNSCIETNLAPLVAQVVESLPKLNKDNVAEKDKHLLDECKLFLSAQQNAFEILANLCTSDDDQWEDREEEGGDDDDDDVDAYDNVPEPVHEAAAGPSELAGLFLQYGLPNKVLSRCENLPVAIQQILAGDATVGLPLLKQITGTQTRALVCLSNMLPLLDLQTPDASFLADLWQHFYALGTSPPLQCEDDFLETVTGVMWAFLRRVMDTPGLHARLAIPVEHLVEVRTLAMASAQEQVRMNAVGLVGCLGRIPAFQPGLQSIGEVLIHAISVDQSLWVLAEGLNSIFDVFAEPEVNAVFVQLQMAPVLERTVNVLKAKLKDARKDKLDRALVGRLDEAKTNLVRFIKYKKAQFK